MTNPEYQRLLRCTPQEVRDRLPGTDADAPRIAALLADLPDEAVLQAVGNLGGHDLAALRAAFDAIDDDRPTVIFAYTIKGHGLPNAGHPQNHSNLLTAAQMAELAPDSGMDVDDPWQRFPDGSAEAELCAATADRLRRDPVPVAQRMRGPDGLRTPDRRPQLDAAGPRPVPARPHPRVAGDRPPGRHGRARRRVQHQPRRVAEQGRCLVLERAAELVRRRQGDDPPLAGTANRTAHRARHRGGQPRRSARRARRDVEPMGRAALPDRDALRPVREPRAGAVVVRHLRRRPVDPRRHALGGHARARGRGSPVDHDPLHRTGAAGLRRLRARLRPGPRMVPARRRLPARARGRLLQLLPAHHPRRRPGARGGADRPGGAGATPRDGRRRRVRDPQGRAARGHAGRHGRADARGAARGRAPRRHSASART